MSRTARTCLALASLALAVACNAEPGPRGELRSGGDVENPGQICAPLNKDGVASFSWETVANRSDAAVEITRVELVDVATTKDGDVAELTVDEWFLTADNWIDGSVSRGPLADPGNDRLPTTVAPGEEAMVNFAVRAPDGVDSQHSMKVNVVYTQEGRDGESSATLHWEVAVAPAGTFCR